MKRTLAFSFLLILSTSVFGMSTKEWDLSAPHMSKCSSGNQRENNSCLSVEYHTVDLKLNELYKMLFDALANPKLLLDSQRAWLKFRDAQCKFFVGVDVNGSGYSYAQNACLIDLTEKRILDLKSIWPCNGCVLFKDEYYQEGKWPPSGWD